MAYVERGFKATAPKYDWLQALGQYAQKGTDPANTFKEMNAPAMHTILMNALYGPGTAGGSQTWNTSANPWQSFLARRTQNNLALYALLEAAKTSDAGKGHAAEYGIETPAEWLGAMMATQVGASPYGATSLPRGYRGGPAMPGSTLQDRFGMARRALEDLAASGNTQTSTGVADYDTMNSYLQTIYGEGESGFYQRGLQGALDRMATEYEAQGANPTLGSYYQYVIDRLGSPTL